MSEILSADFPGILIAGFVVGIVVGLTGMGGGALMTPALIFLGVGSAAPPRSSPPTSPPPRSTRPEARSSTPARAPPTSAWPAG